jgi:tetratricopeptide (TPR) repeat protein
MPPVRWSLGSIAAAVACLTAAVAAAAGEGRLVPTTAPSGQSLTQTIARYGSGSVRAAEAMTALAGVDVEMRRYLDAEPLLIAAHNILADQFGLDDPALAPVLSALARVALARGDKDEARRMAERAVTLDQRNRGRRDPSAADRSERLRTLGAVRAAQEEFADSERVLRRALNLDRVRDDEPATARSLSQLAGLYLRQQRFADALPLIEEATAIDQSRQAVDDRVVADDLYDLGFVYLSIKRNADAQKALRAAIDIMQRGPGHGTARVAYAELELASADRELGDNREADALFADAQRILNAAEDEERRRERRI